MTLHLNPWSEGYRCSTINICMEFFTCLQMKHIMAQWKYTALSGTYLHLDGVEQCRANISLKERCCVHNKIQTLDL